MKQFFLCMIAMVCGSLSLLQPLPAHAENPDPLGVNVGQATGLPDQDIRLGIAHVIQFVLGFLGLIFLVLMLYAGFRWMTSAGNEDAIDTAKKTLTSAIIGLAIILFSYAITQFVIVNLYEVTTDNAYIQ